MVCSRGRRCACSVDCFRLVAEVHQRLHSGISTNVQQTATLVMRSTWETPQNEPPEKSAGVTPVDEDIKSNKLYITDIKFTAQGGSRA